MNLRRLMHKPIPITVDRPWNIEWEMKDKQIVFSYEMSNSHIHNCIKLLDSNILNLTIRVLDGADLPAHTVDESIAEFKRYIKVFKNEIAWRNQNNTFISRTRIRKSGEIF